MKALKIAIDIGIGPGPNGGVAPALRSLIWSLGALTDGPEEYAIVVDPDADIEWLKPLGANQRFLARSKRPEPPPESVVPRVSMRRRMIAPFVNRLHRLLEIDKLEGALWDQLALDQPIWPEVPVSDGFYEGLGCDVVHFPSTKFTLCALPSVYNPHDLQYRHYPQFFTPTELVWRETVYPAACRIAHTVIVNSQWVKDDVVRQYAVWPGKVQVIPEASPTELAPKASVVEPARVKVRYGLHQSFALFPSMTWPHKNHLRLMEALAYLRDRRGLVVPLVCTGARHEASWPQLESRIGELGLTDQVRFLGFVPDEDMPALYRLARCLVLPTLFEANSLPIFEAWHEGTPVACSNVTALPEQVQDAGLLFDPFDITAIGDTIARLYTDTRLCEELRVEGQQRLRDFDWGRTARAYRAVYRRAAGQRLSEEDRILLDWDWMRDPRRPRAGVQA